MTISENVQKQFFRAASSTTDDLIRLPPTVIMSHNLPRQTPKAPFIKTRRRLNIWTVEEHELFLRGLEQFPRGPWKAIAAVVGTKTTRQTMTHAQKYRQKIRRLSAGQTIKIHRVPSCDDDDVGDDETDETDDAVGAVATPTDTIDVRPPPPSVAPCVDTSVAPDTLFQDWEMDAILADLSQSLDIPLEGYDLAL